MLTKRGMFLIMALALVCAVPAFGAQGLDMHGGLSGVQGGDCAACHNNSPSANLRGWANTANPTGLNWYTQPIAKLCWSCHSSRAMYAGASDMDSYAFDDGSHQYGNDGIPNGPNGYLGGAQENYAGTGLPYANSVSGLIDCTTCHNVHNNLVRPFSMMGTANDFSPLCKDCHLNRTGALEGAANSYAVGSNTISLHPTDVAIANDANSTFQATRTRFQTAINPVWDLGGKLTAGATGNMSCQTCHMVHGDGSTVTLHPEDLLVNYNVLEAAANPLGYSLVCKGCHTGGDVGQTVGTGTDHPIDALPGQAFYPPASAYVATGATTGVPSDWLSANHADRGATSYTPTTSTTVRAPSCSSCHDAHGGIGGTAILYGPLPSGVTDWCFSCHSGEGIVPAYHHSTIGNWDSSQLTCGDCHGTGDGTWNAHNGFWTFRGETISASNSDFCEACHLASDPTGFVNGSKLSLPIGTFTALAGDFPASHGTGTGTASHIVNAVPSGISNVVTDVGFDWAGAFGYTPSTWYPTAVSQFGTGGMMLCESCHNILTNAGSLTTGTTVTGGWMANLLLAPYEDDTPGTTVGAEGPNNFFTGVTGDEFCRACHNSDAAASSTATSYVHYPAAHTVRGWDYLTGIVGGVTPYSRAATGLMTTPIDVTGNNAPCPEATTADADGAPNLFSYPAPNQIDCDSCHRPHDASTATTGNGGGETGAVIVQSATVTTAAKTGPCGGCHDTNRQCGY